MKPGSDKLKNGPETKTTRSKIAKKDGAINQSQVIEPPKLRKTRKASSTDSDSTDNSTLNGTDEKTGAKGKKASAPVSNGSATAKTTTRTRVKASVESGKNTESDSSV